MSISITEALKQGGIENAAQEAKWIEKYGTGDLNELVSRRINGEPLQYLLGEWEFFGYPFKVGRGVLIPRPETELLVETAIESLQKTTFGETPTILDLCAGTGCVGIAAAKKTNCNVIAVEKSEEAIKYLKENIRLNKVESRVKIIHGDVFDVANIPIADCILINPPYLSKEEMMTLQKEVTHEPQMALYGGEDGMGFYREFFKTWEQRIKRSAVFSSLAFACEVGDGQAGRVCSLMREVGLDPKIKKDFNGIERMIWC